MLRTKIGIILKISAKKTLLILVRFRSCHKIYKTFFFREKKMLVHTPWVNHCPGDIVKIVAKQPFSKAKSWEICKHDFISQRKF